MSILLRIFSSCCNCDDNIFYFDYDAVIVNNIDNSGQWSKPSNVDSMSYNSVAFEVQIAGNNLTANKSNSLNFNGFKQLSAQSCNCDEKFIPNQTISNIKITTLENINDEYCCNDDVTVLFLVNNCANCDDIGSFYLTIENLTNRINTDLYNSPLNTFLIYLKEPIENSKAKFEIEVSFSDGSSIITTTNLISIV